MSETGPKNEVSICEELELQINLATKNPEKIGKIGTINTEAGEKEVLLLREDSGNFWTTSKNVGRRLTTVGVDREGKTYAFDREEDGKVMYKENREVRDETTKELIKEFFKKLSN